MIVADTLRGMCLSKWNRLLRTNDRRSVLVVCAALLVSHLCFYGQASAGPVRDAKRHSHHHLSMARSTHMPRADQRSPAGETYLGYMYEKGVGVPQDYVVAAMWMQRAADQGYPPAQFLLGLMYDKGHGVKSDYLQAEVWLALAAAHANDRQRDYWTMVRDAVAGKLTIAELAEAQRRAFEWERVYTR